MTRLDSQLAAELERVSQDLLDSLAGSASYGFRKSTLYRGRLSPGCEACGCGLWSCLFLTSRCTTSCFFCPQESNRSGPDALPETLGLTFQQPDDYVGLLEALGIEAVGISGGEPLLVFEERLIPYLERITDRLGRKAYVWLYSNGDLLSTEKLLKLREHGLSELRLNIASHDYDLRPVALATKYLDVVTVEVPVVVEESEKLARALVELDGLGVSHVNLHQLHQTPCNAAALDGRGYTFHSPFGVSERAAVVESELAALRLMRFAADSDLDLPIHYCSFAFKLAVQRMRASARIARLVCSETEEITEAGFIRSMSLIGDQASIVRSLHSLEGRKADPRCWSLSEDHRVLDLHPSLLRDLNLRGLSLRLRYALPTLHQPDDRAPGTDGLHLGPTTMVSVDKPMVAEIHVEEINRTLAEHLSRLFAESEQWSIGTDSEPRIDHPQGMDLIERIAPWEWIPGGFGRYTD